MLLRALEGGPGDVMAKTGPLHARPKAEQAGVNPRKPGHQDYPLPQARFHWLDDWVSREPGGQHQQEGNPPPPHVPTP